MPLATLRIGQMQSGLSEVLVMEHEPGVNYSALVGYFETRSKICSDTKMSITKAEFREILSFTQSKRGNQVCSVQVVWALRYSCSKATRNQRSLKKSECCGGYLEGS